VTTPLGAGAAAPDFTIDAAEGHAGAGERRLRDAAAEAGALVCFLPLADAPVCRDDVRQLARAAAELGAPRRPLLVVSIDRAAHGRRFLRENDAAALIHVADAKLELAAAFGVARRDGVAERATFLIGRDGRVVAGAVHPIGFPRPLALVREWLARAGLS
jgi:peroxiredoxin